MVSNAVSNNLSRRLHVDQESRYATSGRNRYLATVFQTTKSGFMLACPREMACNFLLQQESNRKVCAGESGGTKCPTETATGASKNTCDTGAALLALCWGIQERLCRSVSKKHLLTIDSVAQELGVSRSTVYRLIAARELSTVLVRRCRRVSRTALDRYIADLERSARLAEAVVTSDE